MPKRDRLGPQLVLRKPPRRTSRPGAGNRYRDVMGAFNSTGRVRQGGNFTKKIGTKTTFVRREVTQEASPAERSSSDSSAVASDPVSAVTSDAAASAAPAPAPAPVAPALASAPASDDAFVVEDLSDGDLREIPSFDVGGFVELRQTPSPSPSPSSSSSPSPFAVNSDVDSNEFVNSSMYFLEGNALDSLPDYNGDVSSDAVS